MNAYKKISYLPLIFLSVVFGLFFFILFFDARLLSPSNINWLQFGDSAQQYLGWAFFNRNSWSFPISANNSFGLDVASSILFSDANPLFAFIFKLISHLFGIYIGQYFGVWLLLCLICFSFFSFELFSLKLNSNLQIILCVLFLIFSPPLINRVGHLNLFGHFLIIFAFSNYFCTTLVSNTKDKIILKLRWMVLVSCAAFVHAYLLAIVYPIWLSSFFYKLRRLSNNDIKWFALINLALIVSLFICGYFSVGTGVVTADYGYYRMNLLAFFNAAGWSYVIPPLSVGPGDYEGFAYLGLGGIFIVTLAMILCFIKKIKIYHCVADNIVLVVFLVLMLLYAASNHIGVGSLNFLVPLPHPVLSALNIFRASGRFVWATYYLLLILSLITICVFLKPKQSLIILLVALAIQSVDTSAGWLGVKNEIAAKLNSGSWDSSSPMKSPFWSTVGNKYKHIRYVFFENKSENWKEISYFAYKNGMDTDAVYLARIDNKKARDLNDKMFNNLVSGNFDTDTLYVLSEGAFYSAVNNVKCNKDSLLYVDGFYLLAPNYQKGCNDVALMLEHHKDVFYDVQDFHFSINNSDKLKSMLPYGWSQFENWGVWAVGDKSIVSIPYFINRPKHIKIYVNVYLPKNGYIQKVDLLINGEFYSTYNLKNGSEVLDVDLDSRITHNYNVINFQFNNLNAISPREIGVSDDSRKLSIGLKQITITY